MQVSLDAFKKARKKLIKAKDKNQTFILETQRLIKTEVFDSMDKIEQMKGIMKQQDVKLKIQQRLLKRMLDVKNSTAGMENVGESNFDAS